MIESTGDPFAHRYEVPVPGGLLHVARSGPEPAEADAVALAIHGVTASLMTFRSIARELSPRICMLAPDLRGRGRSANLPGPYGIEEHVIDLLAVLDRAGVSRAVLVGHSMGAYIAARLAAEHPDRAWSVIMLDAGVPFPIPDDPSSLLDTAVTNAIMRLAITFPSADEYVDGWRAHPAFADAWNADIEAYAAYDLEIVDGAERPAGVRSVVSADAVTTDSRELMVDEETRTALGRVRAPVWLVRSPRGLLNEGDRPLIPRDVLDEYVAAHPDAHVENVEGTNHYTLLLGEGPGPARVTAAFRAALGA